MKIGNIIRIIDSIQSEERFNSEIDKILGKCVEELEDALVDKLPEVTTSEIWHAVNESHSTAAEMYHERVGGTLREAVIMVERAAHEHKKKVREARSKNLPDGVVFGA